MDGHESEAHATVLNAEIKCVGVGIGGGLQNTEKIPAMKYHEAME